MEAPDTFLPGDQAAFLEAFQGEDELGVALRAHIYLEAMLERFLVGAVVTPSALKDLNLDYHGKVSLAIAVGLKPKFGPPLRALGKLRNDFAHRPDTQLDKGRVNNLYKSLHSEEKELVLKCFASTKSIAQSSLPSFRQLTSKDQFTIIAVTLRMMLIAAVREVEQGPSDSAFE